MKSVYKEIHKKISAKKEIELDVFECVLKNLTFKLKEIIGYEVFDVLHVEILMRIKEK